MNRFTFIMLSAAASALFSFSGATAQTPVPTEKTSDVVAQIQNGPWTSLSETPLSGQTALYVFHSRTCGFCKAFKQSEKDSLLNAGIDLRFIPFPGSRENTNDVAYISFVRNRALFEDFDARRRLDSPNINASPLYGEAYNSTINSYTLMKSILSEAGQAVGTPLFVYQDTSDQWFVHAGYSSQGFAPVRAALLERRRSQP